jgi:lactocepin
MNFRDVPVEYWAYGYIEWAYCHGIISGYTCGVGCTEFRPEAPTTRAQLTKMIVLAAGFPLTLPPGAPHFADVNAGSPFYYFVEIAYNRGILSGYRCGGPGEPCDAQNRPYFRPGNSVTRAQLAKIIVKTRNYLLIHPASPVFADVPLNHWAYDFIATAASHGVVAGYACGTLAEPCDAQNRPYYRPNADATRAQICKMLFQAFAIQLR